MRISVKLRRNMSAALVGIWLSSGLGCASLTAPTIPKMPEMPAVPAVANVFEKKSPVVEPKEVAVVWTTAVMEKEASRPTRGFGGMVTFYDKDKKKPVRVDGQLTIYAYENLSHEHDDSTPDRKYIFKPEQLKKHYGEGTVGPSYSIWIPWDEAGGPRQEIGLIVRFDPVKGNAVMGKPTHNVLEGTAVAKDRTTTEKQTTGKNTNDTKNNDTKNNDTKNNVEQVCYLPPVDEASRAGEAKASGPQMKTITLTMPRRGVRLEGTPERVSH